MDTRVDREPVAAPVELDSDFNATDPRLRPVLQIAPKLPFPPKDGGRIASWHLSRCLRYNGFATDLVTFSAAAPELASLAALERVYRSTTFIRKDVERQDPLALLAALARGESYFATKFADARLARAINRLLNERHYVATIVESAFMGSYALLAAQRPDRAGRIVLRLHNVEFEILDRLAAGARSPHYRALLQREARLFRTYELEVVQAVQEAWAISARDADILGQDTGTDIKVLPPGVDLEQYSPATSGDIVPRSLMIVGDMRWLPNRNGVLWFCREVWPLVAREFPDAKLRIVGKNPPRSIQRLAGEQIEVTGFVDDVIPYFQSSHLVLVPLSEGSGIRIKIITALAMGKRILSTSVGAEGVDYDGLLIAETPDGWLEAIRSEFSRAPGVDLDAAAFARARYDWRRPLEF